MKRALILGAGGFIGSHLAHRLKEHGYFVRGVDLKRPEWERPAVDEFLIGDLRRGNDTVRAFGDGFDEVNAGEIFGRSIQGLSDSDVLELTHRERQRIFNLGYYTWVEQQGVPVEEFSARRAAGYWEKLRSYLPAWDELIVELNRQAAVS